LKESLFSPKKGTIYDLFFFSPKKRKDRLSKSEAFGRSRRLLALEASVGGFVWDRNGTGRG
jgi:hypothetical protein